MKTKSLFTIAFASLLFIACGQPPKEEKKSSTEEFSELSKEEGFAEEHSEPETINPKLKGEMTTIEVEGGESANVYQQMASAPSKKYLFVIHEWWGLNDQIKTEADRLYDSLGNVNVMALDLYDGRLATTREKATEYMQNADEERIQNIIDAAIESLPEGAEVATIGWCFGGGWSLRTALRAGENTQACVMYYGMPVKEVERLKELNSDVLFIFAEKDEWINQEVANNFESNMKAANKDIKVLSFDADHAFANPSGEHYKEEAAQEANAAALAYLRERM